MKTFLKEIKSEVYDKCGLEISDFKLEPESKDYDACQFNLNGRQIICRNAKITPKKVGQFVTFWKRIENGPIAPFEDSDPFDFFVANVKNANNFGQFVFPKSVLIKKGIISTENKEGKRAFRVYSIWDEPKSKQAARTQKWQLAYFYQLKNQIDCEALLALYGI